MAYKDLEKFDRYKKKYYQEHKEKITNYNKAYRKMHPEVRKKADAKSRKIHREKRLQYNRKWNIENQEYFQKYRNTDKEKERLRKYRETHREQFVNYGSQRRALKKNADGIHTVGEWVNLKAQYNWTCPSCQMQEPKIKLTLDHIIPLSKGGSNNIENIQPLCGRCNSKKHTKEKKYDHGNCQ